MSAPTDAARTASNTYAYEPYGGTTVTGAVVNPWRFASTYFDSTGFYKMGMRYYLAPFGRWTQEDPKEQPLDQVQADRYGMQVRIPLTGQMRLSPISGTTSQGTVKGW